MIVGAGSAGCVLAYRLTEDAGVRVLVLEAGPPDRSILIHMPAALAYPLQSGRFNWAYVTEPEPHMDGRRMACPRGRVLGGSSSINGMAYVRGHALDYDGWAALGLAGWRYRDVLPYFRRAESRESGPDAWRGGDGPLKVSTGPCRNPLQQAFLEAGRQAGYPYTADMNGRQQEGVGPMDMTVHRGERWSAAKGYLHPALQRENLTLRSRALAHAVLFNGTRAVGVRYEAAGQMREAVAEREVILCGGAINSPQLLMLSGVGPADDLRRHGVAVRHHLPGVGADLQDHLEVYVQQACTQPVSLYGAERPHRKLAIGLEWLLFRRGLGATSHFEAGGFIRSRAGVRHPDLQFHFLPIAMNYDGSKPAQCHGYQAHVGPMRPASRGSVSLRSADPRQPPAIRFNYLAGDRDRQEFRDAVRLTREIFAQPAFDPFRGEELSPGPSVRSDAEIDAFVRARAESAYHPCGTCAMGSVVDAEARVLGLEGLRVVDASIMPAIVSGNLNAPTIMLAEKCADAIRGRPPLPVADVEVYEAPDWQTRQR